MIKEPAEKRRPAAAECGGREVQKPLWKKCKNLNTYMYGWYVLVLSKEPEKDADLKKRAFRLRSEIFSLR